jgi:hypothetical protein
MRVACFLEAVVPIWKLVRDDLLEDHNMHLYWRERYYVGQECTNVGHMFVQATNVCTVAPSIVSVCYSPFCLAHKNVHQLHLPSGKCHKIVRVTCQYRTGGPQHGNLDTFLTPRILIELLDVLEDFWTPGSPKCLLEFFILTLTH